MKPALIIGSTCVDVIIHLDHLPVTAEDLHPSSQTMALGGCAYNVAYIMRLLGAPHTFISPVGTGMYGNYVADRLAAAHIPVSVRIPDRDNGCCYCLVEASGERTFLSYHGVEYTFQEEWMESYDSADFGLVYICGLEIEEPTGINLISWLQKHPDLRVCYAPGPRGCRVSPEKASRLMALKPMLHINEQEALELTCASDFREAAARLHAQTANTVIVTLGGEGAYCVEKDGKAFTTAAVPVADIQDTIGAGDAHVGTVLACLTMDIPLTQAVLYANQVAAAVIQVSGASLPPHLLPPLRLPENVCRTFQT